MEIVMRKVDDLIPYGRNQKTHDEKQIKNVANSIKRFGWQQPIVVDEKNVVVIGHCRLLAAQKLGLDEVPVTVASGLSEDEIRELRIADNKTNESEWNYEFLKQDEEELSFAGFDFDFDLLNDEKQTKEREDKSIDAEEYQLIIDCIDENDMQAKYDQLLEMGIECRVSTL